MKLWDIVKTVGAGIISTAVPGGPLIVGAINAALPDDQKLPANATGQQAQDALAAMPAETRAQIMDKEFEVEITQIKETHETVRTMLTADATNPHSTRPYIAKHSFHVMAFSIVCTVSLWVYAVAIENDVLVETIQDGWPFILSVLGPFIVLLRAYFGVLHQEQRNKLAASGGQIPAAGGLGTLVSALLKK